MWATDLIISNSWWSVIPVLATGLVYAAILYVNNAKNKLNKGLTITLFIVRFLSVSLLAFLLLSPYLKSNVSHIEKPILLIGIDNSASILQYADSVYYQNGFQKKLNEVLAQLDDKVEIRSYLFGSEIKHGTQPDFTNGKSDYGAFFDFVNSAWTGTNTGLILLTGDGNYNSGFDPVYLAKNIQIPIFAFAMGDTTDHVDAAIKEIRMNKTAFLDDVVPVEITFITSQLKDRQVNLTVKGLGKTIFSENFLIKTDRSTTSIAVLVEANKVGKHRLQIEINPLPGELNLINNKRNTYMEVIENKQKILLLAYSPHPDISAINQGLKTNKNFEVTTSYLDDFKDNITDYDLVILHQLPSKTKLATQLLDKIKNEGVAVLYILGNQSDIPAFNNYFGGLNILASANANEEAIAVIKPAFGLFTFDRENQKTIDKLPPLSVPLGSYQVNPSSFIFCTQTIKGFESKFPMVLFYQNQESKSGAITGEGLWRWRIYNYLQSGDYNTFDTFLNKSAQYLISKTDRRPFRILASDEYSIFDPIILRAESFNANFELVNSEDVTLKLTNEDGEQFQYLFSPVDKNYKLELGLLPEGVYQYMANTNYMGKNLSEKGEFIVTGISREFMDNKANHRTLYQLAGLHNGSVLYPNEVDQLIPLVDELNLKNTVKYEIKLIEMESLPLLFLLIILLLSFEWFIRKFFGTY